MKEEVDSLTNYGELIDAVLATHPFHTMFFAPFRVHYPNPPYYGTPRHRRVAPSVPWAGLINSPEILSKWEPEVEMRIPDGSEFVNPEEGVHFTSVFVLHKASKSIHVDDTIMYFDQPGFVMRCMGCKHGGMKFHLSLSKDGLYPTAEAPRQFRDWVHKLLEDWDFENVCTAHMGNKIGGGKELLARTLEEAAGTLSTLEHKYKK